LAKEPTHEAEEIVFEGCVEFVDVYEGAVGLTRGHTEGLRCGDTERIAVNVSIRRSVWEPGTPSNERLRVLSVIIGMTVVLPVDIVFRAEFAFDNVRKFLISHF